MNDNNQSENENENVAHELQRMKPMDYYEPKEGFIHRLDTIARHVFEPVVEDYKEKDFMKGLEERLQKAKMTEGPILYLCRALLYVVITFLFSVALGFVVSGITITVTDVSLGLGSGGILSNIGQLLFVLLTTLSFGVVAILFTGIGMYFLPFMRASNYKGEINHHLPHSITFLYALSKSGMNPINMIKSISESEETYGEVAREYQAIYKNIVFGSANLRGALQSRANETPSNDFELFLEDLIGVLDSGGDLERFFKAQTEQFLKKRRQSQQEFLNLLSVLGESYVTLFVAGPLLLIIIITVMSLIGGSQLMYLYMIIYGLLPFGNLGFATILSTLSSDHSATPIIESPRTRTDTGEYKEMLEEKEEGKDRNRVRRIVDLRQREYIENLIKQPLFKLFEEPRISLLFTIPLAIIYYIIVLSTGLMNPDPTSMHNAPTIQTIMWFVCPALLIMLPYSVLHEVQSYRTGKIIGRFPDVMGSVSNSIETGLSLVESFRLEAENSRGRMGDELGQVAREIQWSIPINESLIEFANRVKDPQLSRTMQLITQANEASGNLTDVLNVVTRELNTQENLERERRAEMMIYMGIIGFSFLVYLFVIAALDLAFLSEIEKLAKDMEEKNTGNQQQQLSFTDLPVDSFRMLFFHSSLIQAVASGIIAGLMGSGDYRNGIKISIFLIFAATGVFLFV